jgi:hypothetical protein
MERFFSRIIAAALFVPGCAVPAVAAPEAPKPAKVAPPSTAELIAGLDSDNDHTIDISELGKAASDIFDSIDTDGDGGIDQKAVAKRIAPKEFKKADTDADKILNKNEYFGYGDSLLRLADANKDGVLDEKELESKEGRMLRELLR